MTKQITTATEKKKVLWDCSVTFFDSPACYIPSRQLLQLLTGCLMYILLFLCLLQSFSPVLGNLPTQSETGVWGSELKLITVCVKVVCGAFCFLLVKYGVCVDEWVTSFDPCWLVDWCLSVYCTLLCWLWLWRCVCVWVWVVCVPMCVAWEDSLNAVVCQLQEWSLLLITG